MASRPFEAAEPYRVYPGGDPSRRRGKRGMPRWLTFMLVAMLLFCVCTGVVGYKTLRPNKPQVANLLTETIDASVSSALAKPVNHNPDGIITLKGDDLAANNGAVAGRAGITTGTGGAEIFGSSTELDSSGITLWFAEDLWYSGVPTISDGKVDLVQVTANAGMLRFYLTADGFETGFENGINSALARQGLTPVALALHNDRMTITTRALVASRL